MIVTRHRCTGWEDDALGESRRKTFGVDERLDAFLVDPGQSALDGQHADLTVTSAPAIYFTYLIPRHELDEWDEWTVNGRRYTQDGEPRLWPDPWPNPRLNTTVVKLDRKVG